MHSEKPERRSTSPAGRRKGVRADALNPAYGTAKAATDKLAADMAVDLEPFGVAALSLHPGLVSTESVVQNGIDVSTAQSPHFVGRTVVCLASDPRIMEKSGRAFSVEELANEYRIAG